jgi:dynein heavy chain, axonemal
MVLMGSYEEAVKMMGDMNFLYAITNFPKDNMNDETVELLCPYFAASDFNYDSARKVREAVPAQEDVQHFLTVIKQPC